MLLAGVVAMTAVALILAAAFFAEQSRAEVVKLGRGVASVDAQPVSDLGANSDNETQPVASPSERPIGSGDASFYGNELAGNRTASGEVFDPERLTAAHRTLPLGSRVRVTNVGNGESVIVRINDRGPFHGNRVIDLSKAAARTIGLIQSGTGRVSLSLLVG